MSLNHISSKLRWRLRLHGCLLMLGTLAIGFGANTLLARMPVVSQAFIRVPLAMLIFYVAFVIGLYFCLTWWAKYSDSKSVYLEQTNVMSDYDAFADTAQKMGKKGFESLKILTGLELAQVFPPILIVVLPVAAIGLALFAFSFPFLITEAMGGFLAELVLEFIVGYALLRKTSTLPATEPLTLGGLFQKTALFGVAMLLIAIVLTFVLIIQKAN